MNLIKKIKYWIVLIPIIFVSCENNQKPKEEVKYEIIIKPSEDKNTFETLFEYTKETLGLLAIFLGMYLTYPLLKKKLVENHITNALEKIQDTNRVIQCDCQQLIDKYVPLTYSNDFLRKPIIESVYEDIRKLYYSAQQSSSDVITILFYLKNTLQGVLRYYEYGKYAIITSRELYGLVISSLEITNFYCSQVVQIPKSTKIQERNSINPKIKEYVSYSNYKQYKYFSQGVINDANSTHLVFFYDEVNKNNHVLFKIAAFKIFINPAPIACLLLLKEIYAPLILEKEYNSPFLDNGKLSLYLIGFSISNILKVSSNETTEVVDLFYSNPNDYGRFAEHLKFEDLKSNFKDAYLSNSKFDLSKIKKMYVRGFETISLQIELATLQDSFKKNKPEFKKVMKKHSLSENN